MTDQQERKVIEISPSVEGDVSAAASANAPFVYFELVPFAGVIGGNIASLTLTAQRQMGSISKNTVGGDHVVTAHLKCNFVALQYLRQAIDNLLLAAAPPPEGSKPS